MPLYRVIWTTEQPLNGHELSIKTVVAKANYSQRPEEFWFFFFQNLKCKKLSVDILALHSGANS